MLAVLSLANAVNWADRQVVPILFPAIREEMGLTDFQLGVVGGLAFAFVYAISGFFFGSLADRGNRRNVAAMGLLAWSLATAASGLADSFGWLVAARFATGVGEASLFPCAMSLITQRFPASERGRAMGVFGAATAVGGGLGIVFGGYLAETLGWREVFFIYGAVGVALLPVMLTFPEPERRSQPGAGLWASWQQARELLRDPRLFSLWTMGMILIGSALGYAAWIPSFFERLRGFSIAEAGLIFGLAQLIGGVGGSLIGGVLTDRARRRRVGGQLDFVALAAAIALPLAAGTLLIPFGPVMIALGITVPVTLYAAFPAVQATVAELVPPDRTGIAFALQILFMGGFGAALGPVIVGGLSDYSGSLLIGLMAVVVGLAISVVLALLTARLIRSHHAAQTG